MGHSFPISTSASQKPTSDVTMSVQLKEQWSSTYDNNILG